MPKVPLKATSKRLVRTRNAPSTPTNRQVLNSVPTPETAAITTTPPAAGPNSPEVEEPRTPEESDLEISGIDLEFDEGANESNVLDQIVSFIFFREGLTNLIEELSTTTSRRLASHLSMREDVLLLHPNWNPTVAEEQFKVDHLRFMEAAIEAHMPFVNRISNFFTDAEDDEDWAAMVFMRRELQNAADILVQYRIVEYDQKIREKRIQRDAAQQAQSIR